MSLVSGKMDTERGGGTKALLIRKVSYLNNFSTVKFKLSVGIKV